MTNDDRPPRPEQPAARPASDGEVRAGPGDAGATDAPRRNPQPYRPHPKNPGIVPILLALAVAAIVVWLIAALF